MQSIQYKYHNGEGSVSISKGSFDAGSNENFVTVSFDAMSIRNKLAKYYKIQIYADNIIVDEFIEQVLGNDLYISKSFNLYKFFSENDWENMMFSAVIYPLLNNKLTTKMFFASPQTKFVCNIDAYLKAQENGEQKDVLCTVVNALTPVTYTWNVDGVITETAPINDLTNLLENITLGEEETQVSCTIIDGMGCTVTKNLIFEAPEELDPDEGFYRQGAGIMLAQYWVRIKRLVERPAANSYLNIFIPESSTRISVYYGQDLTQKYEYTSTSDNEIINIKNIIPRESYFEIDADKPVISFVNNLENAAGGGYEIPPEPYMGNEYFVTRLGGRKDINEFNFWHVTKCYIAAVASKENPNPSGNIYIHSIDDDGKESVEEGTVSYPNQLYTFVPNNGSSAHKISSDVPICVFQNEFLKGTFAGDLTCRMIMDNNRCGTHYIVPEFTTANNMFAFIINISDDSTITVNRINTNETEEITLTGIGKVHQLDLKKNEGYLEIISDNKINVLFGNNGSAPDPDVNQCHPVDSGIKRTGFINHTTSTIKNYQLIIITHKDANKDKFTINPTETIVWSDQPTPGGYILGRVNRLSQDNAGYYISAEDSFIAYVFGENQTHDSVMHSLGRNWLKTY